MTPLAGAAGGRAVGVRAAAALLVLALGACGIEGAPEPVAEAPAAALPGGAGIAERIPPG